MVGVRGSNKLSLYVISTDIFLVPYKLALTNRIVEKLMALLVLANHIVVKAYCTAVPQRTFCSLQQNSVRLYQERVGFGRTPACNIYSVSFIQYDCIRYVTEVVSVNL
jgi:hypothetical protein